MAENLMNVPKSTMIEFFDDLEGRLALLTGIISPEAVGLTLEQIRKPMLVIGQPGIGKTCGIISIIKQMNETKLKSKGIKLGFKKILLGQTVVGSMSGIPVVMKDGSVKRVQVPDLPDVNRDGEYGVLFLDEITTADEAQVQPALGLCDDSRNIGTYTLPEHWIVIAAGNGADCSNFIRLDDMTISRFKVYDISYDFNEDWRGYAYNHNIDSSIIAFLSFSPTSCVKVESSDVDVSGKLFACPRTWERLSQELKMHEALGKPVPQDAIGRFAGRIIGANAGREFQAFTAYKQKVTYDAEKILKGTEKEPDTRMEKQVFYIILRKCIDLLSALCEKHDDGSGNYPEEVFVQVANVVNWFLTFESSDLEATFSAVIALKNDDGRIRDIILDEDFELVCPKFTDFITQHFDVLVEVRDAMNMSF